jgi:hypothetical protein
MQAMKQQILDALDFRIAKLQELRDFTASEDFGEPPSNGSAPARKRGRKPQPTGNRKEQMHTWLKKHPGSARRHIVAGTGIPAGTVGSYLFSETKLFENRDGNWYAR